MAPDTWEILIIKHGTRATMRSDVFMNYGFYDEPDNDFRLDYYLWVLRNGEQIIHVDTGYSATGAAKRNRTVLIDPLEALSTLGIHAADGNPVVVTHAHYDHIGNIAAFANSQIFVSRRELEFWGSAMANKPLFSHFGDQKEVSAILEAKREGRVREFDGHIEIAPGVELIEVGGHTPGQLVVRVSSRIGTVILAADALHFHEEIERDMLFQSMTDLPQSYRALDWLRAQDVAAIITGHDCGELERFEPVDGLLQGLASIVGAHGG